MKNFIYDGFTFKPITKLSEELMTSTLANDFRGGFKTKNYKHEDFYKAAKTAKAQNYDEFEIVELGDFELTSGKVEPKVGDQFIPCGGHICLV